MPAGANTSQRCVFCEIANGNAFARIVYHNDDLLCFFPLRPEMYGHTLITSRKHYVHVGDCPPAFGAALFEATQKLGAHYSSAIGATGFNLMNASGADANQSVPHLHFHFLPRRKDDGLNTWPALPEFATDLDELLDKLKLPLG